MKTNRLSELILELQEEMQKQNIDPRNGLPEELFLFSTTLAPIANVDLFITNDNGEVLLSWRDDEHYGEGWHIPGGCLRLKETMAERLQKTALKEIGCEITFNENPILIKELFVNEERKNLKNQLERSHNISVLFECFLPNDYNISNCSKFEHNSGYLKWFNSVPDDLLQAHKDIYGDFLTDWFKNRSK